MRFLRSRQDLEHILILRHHEGGSIRELSRQFQLGRNTVRRILRAHAMRLDSRHEVLTKRLKRSSKLDGFDAQIKKLLEKYPKITGLRIYEELKEAGYPGGISILREQLKKLRALDREPVIRFETEPGQQGQMDWSPYTIPFTGTGKSKVQCFSYILGFSGGNTSTLRSTMTSTTLSGDIRTSSSTFRECPGSVSTITKRRLYSDGSVAGRSSIPRSPPLSPIITASPLPADRDGQKPRGKSKRRSNMWKATC